MANLDETFDDLDKFSVPYDDDPNRRIQLITDSGNKSGVKVIGCDPIRRRTGTPRLLYYVLPEGYIRRNFILNHFF